MRERLLEESGRQCVQTKIMVTESAIRLMFQSLDKELEGTFGSLPFFPQYLFWLTHVRDVFRSHSGAFRKLTDLIGDNGKAASPLTGPSCFNSSI